MNKLKKKVGGNRVFYGRIKGFIWRGKGKNEEETVQHTNNTAQFLRNHYLVGHSTYFYQSKFQ